MFGQVIERMSDVFAPPGLKPFERHCYVVANDGDAQQPGNAAELSSCATRRARDLEEIRLLIRTIPPLESLHTQQLREMERKEANTHESVRHDVDLALRKVNDGTEWMGVGNGHNRFVACSQLRSQWISQIMGNVASDADLRCHQREIAAAVSQAKKDTLASLREIVLDEDASSPIAQAQELFVQQVRQVLERSVGEEVAARFDVVRADAGC